MPSVKIGIIGGSGLSNPNILENKQEKYVETPFGKMNPTSNCTDPDLPSYNVPIDLDRCSILGVASRTNIIDPDLQPSDALILGEIQGVDCILLARHGRGHTIMPSNVNYRANLWALKEEGCTHILVTTACGSLQENIHPGDIVVLDQFIDRTHRRQQTFYDGSPGAPVGICHLQMAKPFCAHTSQVIMECIKELGLQGHMGGTMLTIEGPRFSSTAESKMWNSWGAHTINMTTVPEVILAKELGLCYASMGLVTDYDSWREDVASIDLYMDEGWKISRIGEFDLYSESTYRPENTVNVESVMATFAQNSERARNVILKAIPKIAAVDWTERLKVNQDLVKGSIILPHSY